MLYRGLCVVAVAGLCLAQRPAAPFVLLLPDFFDTPFEGGQVTIEIPARPIQRLQILIKDADKRNINPGRYRVFVNGKGIGSVFDERRVPEGTLLVMQPETLQRRNDRYELFDPNENALEITAESRTGRKYYQSWVLRTADAHENALFGNYTLRSPDDPKGIPPDLVISEPTTPPVLPMNQREMGLQLKGRTSRGAQIRVNGADLEAAAMTQVVEFARSINVTSATSQIEVEATDPRGNQRRVVIPVYHEGPKLPKARFLGQKYAIVIGVSLFGTAQGVPPGLPLAAMEAKSFASNLIENAGFRRENIRVLTDEQASLELVRVALSDFAAKAQLNDVLVIYLKTYGLHDPRPGHADRLYLALYGSQLEQLEMTALGLPDLEQIMNRSVRTNQCFLFFDVGHILEGDWKFTLGKSLVNNYILNLFDDKPDWSVLVSGSTDEISGIGPDNQSLFGHWLTTGIAGTADLNRDGVVTSKELFTFVTERVRSASDGMQNPRFHLSHSGDQAFTQ